MVTTLSVSSQPTVEDHMQGGGTFLLGHIEQDDIYINIPVEEYLETSSQASLKP